MNRTFPFLVASLTLAGAACSSAEPTSSISAVEPVDDACTRAGTAMCNRACSCSTDGECRLGLPSDSGIMALYNFVDLQACLDLYVVYACSTGGQPGFDYATCEAKNLTAACVTVAEYSAFPMQPECEIP